MEIGSTKLELIEPSGEDSPVEKFIQKKGEGLHHICFLVDDIDEGGYRISYSYIGQILDELYFYRKHTSPEEFDVILQKKVGSLGHWHNNPYSNVSTINGFTCYFEKFNITGVSPYNKRDNEFKFSLSVLFVYKDSLQVVKQF